MKPKRGRRYRYVVWSERRPPSKEHAFDQVYFVQSGDDGPIKIGCAKDVQRRIYTLQNANPEVLHLRLVLKGGWHENEIHRRFAHLRIRGEWFKPGEDLLRFIGEPDPAPQRPFDGVAMRSARGSLVVCDYCHNHLSDAERATGDPLCPLCRCRFEDLELEPECYAELGDDEEAESYRPVSPEPDYLDEWMSEWKKSPLRRVV